MRHFIVFLVIAILIVIPEAGMTQVEWEKYPANPVFEGDTNSWDEIHVSHPNVLFNDGWMLSRICLKSICLKVKARTKAPK